MKPLRIGIIGYGKIARDQHAPAIAGLDRFGLAASVSRSGTGAEGVPSYTTHTEMLAAGGLDAVAICTPPGARYAIARDCIEAGLQVLLEKPPAVTLSEIEDLACLAEAKGVTLFATWHARFNAAVEAAARALAGERIAAMEIVWREDVRKWHPGQQWIWEPGGFGVFDPGINAFSIATRIFPGPLFVKDAVLHFPENRQAPIAAELHFASPAADADMPVTLDWRHSGDEAWTINVRTVSGKRIELSEGGSRLTLDGAPVAVEGPGEYPAIYQHFLDLVDTRTSDVDVRPLRLVGDAYLVGSRATVAPFED
ncbi:Gfo/Idh/MocA family oxidoreductase [Sphingosinicella sp. LY1275]|uniref:Gfo/Idh/MocA family protein n=1 Tax=Sphingosinicella sp. LY1275 TaxID=3095379 RepID=UPI002ADECC43|nr:Gfo/Idh/MocA family oxidoreductase [Sphingosinicella sp. LY1275]MEA1015659.1 Gfo/Idh/MocA family oxidoreductase [Sphingosinicella sp. LY1275]